MEHSRRLYRQKTVDIEPFRHLRNPQRPLPLAMEPGLAPILGSFLWDRPRHQPSRLDPVPLSYRQLSNDLQPTPGHGTALCRSCVTIQYHGPGALGRATPG